MLTEAKKLRKEPYAAVKAWLVQEWAAAFETKKMEKLRVTAEQKAEKVRLAAKSKARWANAKVHIYCLTQGLYSSLYSLGKQAESNIPSSQGCPWKCAVRPLSPCTNPHCTGWLQRSCSHRHHSQQVLTPPKWSMQFLETLHCNSHPIMSQLYWFWYRLCRWITLRILCWTNNCMSSSRSDKVDWYTRVV